MKLGAVLKSKGLKILLAVLFVLIIFINADLSDVFNIVKLANIVHMGLALLVVLVIRLLMSLRWKLILDSYSMKIPYVESVYIILVSGTLGFFSPGGVAADLMRGHHAYKKDKDASKISTVVVFDKLIGVFSMVVLVSLISNYLLFFSPSGDENVLKPVALVSSLIVLGLIVSVVILIRFERLINHFSNKLPAKVSKVLAKVYSVFKEITQNTKLMIRVFFLSLMMQLLRSLMFYFILQSLSLNVALIHVVAYFPIVFMLMLLPITFGGIGVREGATFVLFEQFGVNLEYSIGSGLIFYGVQLMIALLGFVVYLMFSRKFKEIRH